MFSLSFFTMDVFTLLLLPHLVPQELKVDSVVNGYMELDEEQQHAMRILCDLQKKKKAKKQKTCETSTEMDCSDAEEETPPPLERVLGSFKTIYAAYAADPDVYAEMKAAMPDANKVEVTKAIRARWLELDKTARKVRAHKTRSSHSSPPLSLPPMFLPPPPRLPFLQTLSRGRSSSRRRRW